MPSVDGVMAVAGLKWCWLVLVLTYYYAGWGWMMLLLNGVGFGWSWLWMLMFTWRQSIVTPTDTTLAFLKNIWFTMSHIWCDIMSKIWSYNHCEILGSYLQQLYQHHVSTAQFEAEPHSQEKANKWQRISFLISRSKLTNSVLTDNISLPCSAR